jgi:predicted transcriptional regulator
LISLTEEKPKEDLKERTMPRRILLDGKSRRLCRSYSTALETREILADAELMAQIREGIKDMKEGRLVLWEEVQKELELL